MCSWIIARSRMDKPNPCARIGVTRAEDCRAFPLVWGFFTSPNFSLWPRANGMRTKCLWEILQAQTSGYEWWWQEMSLFL